MEGHAAATDKEFNIESIGTFNYAKGLTSNTKYFSKFNTISSTVTIIDRKSGAIVKP